MNFVNKKMLLFPFVCFIVGCSAKEEKVSQKKQKTEKIPLIYCSDLYHPHVDPDDHFDIAAIYAIPEFDIKAIILVAKIVNRCLSSTDFLNSRV